MPQHITVRTNPHVTVNEANQHITLSNSNQHITVNSSDLRVSVVSSGPQGPPGAALPSGGIDGQVLGKDGNTTTWISVGSSEEIDTKIAMHNQATPIHTNATSGRDFAALFQNGLI